ncbi:5'-methylthioadenosine/S-adenosylhomocysteine nucleosidase [Candidatus Erwinia haradaeae]|uniref:5'-methylthioadenosine/S-adenosylhomocysteine nucleosidase n=1 Tax=Candidatus Erwinia haradaeae TaxID=1922217 RepID=A0A803FTK1_9GAMM|nr:5'-methylthioadenosine/S-adenosylhomocysteine nucleosidase [Candidatus Erwinia haradaeae]VFP88058.1 5'-methylthioadenosine/S-adenosylhomocysteine nucleosidase [Candidatus Erwinia haradaeae]
MKIGIIGAMEAEIVPLRNKLKNKKKILLVGSEIYSGMLNNIEIFLLKSGIGKVAATLSSTLFLYLYKPDLIINIGSAGGLDPLLKIGDIIISDEVMYHDVDVTACGYARGQMIGCPVSFQADKHLITVAQLCSKQLNLHSVSGLIVSGDAFINGGVLLKNIRNIFPGAIAVDMEAAAVGHVCYQFSIPFIVIRSVSDIADQESPCSFNHFLDLASSNSSLMIESFLYYLITQSSC